MHFVYVLQNLKNTNLYIGYTNNLKKRVLEHNRKINLSTKPFVPWKLIFVEGYIEITDAKRREKYLKTNQGSRLLKRMLKEYLFKNK